MGYSRLPSCRSTKISCYVVKDIIFEKYIFFEIGIPEVQVHLNVKKDFHWANHEKTVLTTKVLTILAITTLYIVSDISTSSPKKLLRNLYYFFLLVKMCPSTLFFFCLGQISHQRPPCLKHVLNGKI